MAGLVHTFATGRGFLGLTSIYQYTNSDGKDPATVCGQAACATILTYTRAKSRDIQTLREIEKLYPPDLLGGALGTSPSRIKKILEHYGADNLYTVNTVKDLKRWVRSKFPVICLIQNAAGWKGVFSEGAHWFVVFAYDDTRVFVTNYTPTHLDWNNFKAKWDSPISRSAQMIGFRGIVNASRIVREPLIA